MVELPPLPDKIAALPKDHRGYPVPWFVAQVDGEWDFRVVGPGKMAQAFNKNLCWVCGQAKGTHHAFVIGPMCAVTRVNSEPPSHLECALFSAIACPFLSKPRMKRNAKDLPGDAMSAAGLHIDRNPGAACVWVTRSYQPFNAGNGVLFNLGDPVEVRWFASGRSATRAEIMASLESGLPILYGQAKQDGPSAERQLDRMVERLQPLLPQI